MTNKAEELIACLEAEIVKRDARIAELEAESAEWSPVMQRLGDENQSLRAALKSQQSSAGVVLPDDRELLDFAVSEQFLLFCDEEEFLDIAKSVLSKFARLNSCRAQSVPVDMPERWEDRLTRMHPTIQAGCWPKRWVDDAKDYELGELRALLAQSVPDGYVLVPVDPTPEMLDRYPFNVSAVTSEPMDKEDLRVVYQAMIAAAPPLAQSKSKEAE